MELAAAKKKKLCSRCMVSIHENNLYLNEMLTFLLGKQATTIHVAFQFKNRVNDIAKPDHDDYYLIKWLKGLYNSLDISKLVFSIRNIRIILNNKAHL